MMSLSQTWLQKVQNIVGNDSIITDAVEMEPFSHDEIAFDDHNRMPLAVVKPDDERQIAEIVKVCSVTGVPVTVRGGGTGLSAACVPSEGGVVLSMERLNGVIEKDVSNRSITVEAGMTMGKLYEEVEEMQLFFPPHPGDEGAYIGGAVATNAGGARAVKYGTIKRFVLGLRVILADGTIVTFGGKYVKASVGYHLLDLMIGSEGTLGIITGVTLSLLPPPGSIQTLVVPFETVGKGIESVPALLKAGIVPCAVEFIDHSVLRVSERLVNKEWPVHQGEASLMIILDGTDEEEVMAHAEKVGEIMEEQGALDILLADRKSKQQDILEIRSMMYEALRPGMAEGFDICVPRSEIVGHVEFVGKLEKEIGVPLPTFGHAADGNIHTMFMKTELVDGEIGAIIPDWEEKLEHVRDRIYEDAIRRGGVISGEHGVGLSKKDSLAKNIGDDQINLMRRVKRAFDPNNILNPGKVV